MPRRRRSLEERQRIIDEQISAEKEELLRSQPMSLRSGDKNSIEEDAERILAVGRRNNGVDDVDLYLSREQMILRKNKEVYSTNGVPDASLVSGLYRRAYNPEFGARPKGVKGSDD